MKNNIRIAWRFGFFLLPLQHRLQLPTSGFAGGLIYEKDVFERLSLWFVNFANSNHHNRQMTTEASRRAYLYTILI